MPSIHNRRVVRSPLPKTRKKTLSLRLFKD